MSRRISPCTAPDCGKIDDIENCDYCRKRVLSRTAAKKRRDDMRLDPDYVPSRGGQEPIQNSKPRRFTGETRNLSLLSEGKLERAFDRIIQRW